MKNQIPNAVGAITLRALDDVALYFETDDAHLQADAKWNAFRNLSMANRLLAAEVRQ